MKTVAKKQSVVKPAKQEAPAPPSASRSSVKSRQGASEKYSTHPVVRVYLKKVLGALNEVAKIDLLKPEGYIAIEAIKGQLWGAPELAPTSAFQGV